MTIESKKDLKNKILLGLVKSYEKMLLFKKQKNSEIVVFKNNKIVKLKP